MSEVESQAEMVTLDTPAVQRRFGTAAALRRLPTAPLKTMPHHPPFGVLPAIQSLMYVLVVALFLMTFTVQPIRIPSASMEPTLLVGDFLLLDRQLLSGDDDYSNAALGCEPG